MSIDDDGAETTPHRAQVLLDRIAATLGCSADTFTIGAPDTLSTKGAAELLTIWSELEHDGDRERLLEFARQLIASR